MSSEESPNRRRAIQTPLESSAWFAGGKRRDGRLRVRYDPQIKLPRENPPTMTSREESN
jgi:hypothetical protein